MLNVNLPGGYLRTCLGGEDGGVSTVCQGAASTDSTRKSEKKKENK